MTSHQKQNRFFVLGLIGSLIAVIGMTLVSKWSDGMEKRAGLGFHHGLTAPVLALELARKEADFNQVFGIGEIKSGMENVWEDVSQDIGCVQSSQYWDILFLISYTLTFTAMIWRLRDLGVLSHTAAKVLVPAVCGMALLDLMEDAGILLELWRAATPGFISVELWFSLGKWLLSFAVSLILGWRILHTLRATPLGGAWALAGLLLFIGGITGLLGLPGVYLPRDNALLMLVAPGFAMMGLAAVPVLVAWRWR